MPGSLDETQTADDAASGVDDTALADPASVSRDPSGSRRRPPVSSSAAATGERGSTIGRYVVLGILGQGGMGVVYTAYDPELDRRVALKLLRPEGRSPEIAATRLLREAQAMAKLSHPHVVTVHDVGQHAGSIFIAMEFVEGRTLSDWVDEGSHSSADVLKCFAAAGRGLAAAHRAGLVHRDFKPDNVLLGDDGRVQVADFGLARSSGESTSTGTLPDGLPPEDLGGSQVDVLTSSTRSGVSVASRVTRTGAFLGTPAYMSPEQFRGGELGPASDQFSFAVALWEALYAERPFGGETPNALAFQVLRGLRKEPPNPSAVPRRVRAALERALHQDPESRHADMDTFLVELEEAKINRWLLPAVLAIVGLGTMAWAQTLTDPAAADPCSAGQQELAKVWSPNDRETLRATLAAVDVPWAKDAAQRSVAEIDKWGEHFKLAHREACEATHVKHSQSEQLLDLRMLCLDRRLRRLENVKTTLAEADEKILKRVEPLLRDLDDLDLCADPETLNQRQPLPTEEAARKSVLELQGIVEQAATLRGLGRYKDAIAIARTSIKKAEKLKYMPVLAELLFQIGRSLSANEDHDEAHEMLFSAFAKAIESGEDGLAAQAATALVSTSADLGRKDGGDRWFEIAEALCLRGGGLPGTRGALYTNRGIALRKRDDTKGAVAMHTRAYNFYVEAHGGRSMHAADSIFNRSTIHWDMGRNKKAARDVRLAAQIWREHVGDDHPRIFRAMGAEALIVLQSGEGKRAVELQREVVKRLGQLHGRNSIQVADARLNLSAIAAEAGQYKRAWDANLAARKHYEQAGKIESLGYGQLLGNGSVVARKLGRPEKALALAEQALEVLTKQLGDDHHHLSTAHILMALALEDLGRVPEARGHAKQALVIMLDARGADHPGLLEYRYVFARIEAKLDHPAAARKQMEAATTLSEDPDIPPAEAGRFWREHARWLGAQGDDKGRDNSLAHARSYFLKAGGIGRQELKKMDDD